MKPAADEEQDEGPSLWHGLWAVPAAAILYLAAIAAVMQQVPRASEGVRRVVDWPWPLYASLPTILAGIIGVLGILAFVRSPPLRIALLIAFGLTLALCSFVGITLLRRDFIGKL